MPFTNLFHDSATCPSSSSGNSSTAASYTTTRPNYLQTAHLPLSFPLTQAHTLQQMDLLGGDEDQLSGWEVSEECAWLEAIPSHCSRPSIASKLMDGRPKKPRRPIKAVAGSRAVEMLEDVDLEDETVDGYHSRDGVETVYEGGGCFFDAVEEEELAMKPTRRPPLSPGESHKLPWQAELAK